MAKRKRTVAWGIVQEAVPMFAGLSMMGETEKFVPSKGEKIVEAGFGAIGMASSTMMLGAAKGVLDGLDELDKKARWNKR